MTSLKKILIPLILFVLFFYVLFNYTFIYFSKDLPDIEEITSYEPKTISKIYDRNDFLFGLFFDEKREYRNIDKIPTMIKNAFISAEDKNFFKHNGYDPIGYLKALISFIKEGKLRGASTITQQITKGFLLSGERTFERKIKELILALRLEEALSKDKILEIYLNEVFLGGNSYGVVAASKTYFSKDLEELTPGEAAFLAALPKSPSKYNPKYNLLNAINRRNFVLKEMYQNGYLDSQTKKEELNKDLITNFNNISSFQNNYKLIKGFLADEIMSDMQNLFGSGFISKGGLTISISLNAKLQKKSQDLLISNLIDLDIKNNDFKPIIFNTNIKHYDKKDWEIFFSDNIQKKYNNIWDLGVVVQNIDGKYLIKTEKSDILLNLKVPYESTPAFISGDAIYYKVDKDGQDLIYKQVPFYDGGIIIFDKITDDILVLNGGFNYLSSNLNMVTERKENFKDALVPFFLYIMIDQNLLSKSNADFTASLNKNKKLLNDIYIDSMADNSNVIAINKKYISELGLNYLSRINDKNHFFNDTDEVLFSTELTLNDLLEYYKLLLNKNSPSETTFLNKVSDHKKIFFELKDNNSDSPNFNYALSNKKYDLIIKNENVLEFLNLKNFSYKNSTENRNKIKLYGWHTFEEQKGYDLFIGFDNSKIIGCYITRESSDKKNGSKLLHNSCLNIVKKLF